MRKTVILKLCNHHTEVTNLGCIATGFYNVANYARRQEWQNTGKIPNYYQQYYALRDHPLARLLHSHIPQQILKTLENNYQSWYALRKTHPEANPPMFRKKGQPSTFHFTNFGFTIRNDHEIELSTKNTFGSNIVIRVEGRMDLSLSTIANPKILQFVFRKHMITIHLTYEFEEHYLPTTEKAMAIDLGIKNFAVTYDTDGNSRIYKGGEILAIGEYFDKHIRDLQSRLPKYPNGKQKKGSKAISRLHRQKSAQIRQMLHGYANNVCQYCTDHAISTVVVGDLTNIRQNKDWGTDGNRKLHQWRYSQFTEMLRYKLAELGIRLEVISERYTSRTCHYCGSCKRKDRVTRGWYRCSKCGYENHADINGAMNILSRYQHGVLTPSCTSRVNSGIVIKWASAQLVCTEAPAFRRG